MGTTHAMSHADAAWLHMDRPTNLMTITSAMWFDTPIEVSRLRDVVMERLVEPYPRFSQVVVEGLTGPHWEDHADFDVDLHLHHMALPAPGDAAVLQGVVADIMSQPLDRSRPLWSLTLFDGYGDGCALVCRMHHAIADGIALSRVMLGLTDDAEHARTARFAPASTARRRLPLEGTARELAHLAGAAAHEATETLVHPEHLGELLREGVEDAKAVASLLVAGNERTHALHGELGVAQRVAWSRPIPLEDVKAAGRRREATVNDVLVACVAASVRAHLLARSERPEDVHAMVPFNLRPLDQPLPRDLGNRFGLVLLALPVGVADPEERVAEASRRMRAIKSSRQGVASYGILGVIGHTPAAVESRIVDIFSAKATMVLTNVPGPRAPVTLAGARAGGVLVWAPCSGAVGMSVSVFSYAGEVTVGFMVNGRLADDPQELVAAFEAAVDELL
jgi:WS/DGAT/MGAT family acyltransferase